MWLKIKKIKQVKRQQITHGSQVGALAYQFVVVHSKKHPSISLIVLSGNSGCGGGSGYKLENGNILGQTEKGFSGRKNYSTSNN
jgi:hypothetical protein